MNGDNGEISESGESDENGESGESCESGESDKWKNLGVWGRVIWVSAWSE